MDFRDRVAVITGAVSGLGRSLALQLYTAGARLALCDVDMLGLEETVRLAGGTGSRTSQHCVDVADRGRMSEFAARVLSRHGRVDVLVNNAGWFSLRIEKTAPISFAMIWIRGPLPK